MTSCFSGQPSPHITAEELERVSAGDERRVLAPAAPLIEIEIKL